MGSLSIMVDTGATHNFITPDEAKRVGLNVVQGEGWLKTVNSSPKQLNGIAREVDLCLGNWSGKVDFSVILMDDFKVVLGMEFFKKVNAFPMPYYDSICVLEKGITCMVLASSGTNGTHLSAMQVKKGFKRGEATYLATLKEENPKDKLNKDIPHVIQKVLEENKDIMPPELSKKLPPH